MHADLVPIPSGLIERLATLDVDVEALLEHAGIAASRFQGSKTRLTTGEFFAFWRAAEKAGASRDLGLRLGSTRLPHQLDVASFAALHSSNVGEALERLARYKRLVCPEEVSVETVGAEARVRFHWTLAQEHPPRLLIDAVFASVLWLARSGTGQPVSPRRLELTRRREDEDMLVRHFGCRVRFGAPVDLLVFDARLLPTPFTTRNEDLVAVLLPGLDAALDERAKSGGLVEDVRAALGQRMRGERPTVEKVARALHLSPRTLQRRLEEHGTSYQELLGDVRRQEARRLLGSTDLDAGEVAFLLGFEELNSFTRAFQAWEGTTPTRWREA